MLVLKAKPSCGVAALANAGILDLRQTPSQSGAHGPHLSSWGPLQSCGSQPGSHAANPWAPLPAAGGVAATRAGGVSKATRGVLTCSRAQSAWSTVSRTRALRCGISSPITVRALRGGGRERRSRPLASTVSGVVARRGKGQVNVPSAQSWPSLVTMARENADSKAHRSPFQNPHLLFKAPSDLSRAAGSGTRVPPWNTHQVPCGTQAVSASALPPPQLSTGSRPGGHEGSRPSPSRRSTKPQPNWTARA